MVKLVDKMMDRTTKLIRYQRITIVLLLATSVVAGVSARLKGGREAAWREEAQKNAGSLWIVNVERREEHAQDERVIRALDERLRRYEARFGEIDTVRQGEGTFIRNPRSDR